MPPDSGIKDTCYYFEDGNPWWASPDIRITGPDLTGKATRPSTGSTVNTVRVNVRRKGGAGTPPCFDAITTGDSDYLQVDLYICNPTSSPYGPTSPNVKKIRHFIPATSTYSEIMLGAGGSPYLGALPAPGGNSPVTVNWNLPENPSSPHPAEAPDHKCLIARVYTFPNDSPSSGSFQVVDDQHYAQENICINFCSSPCEVEIMMLNGDQDLPRTFQLRVVQDLKPNPVLRQVIDYTLREAQVGDYRLAEKTPQGGFGLTIKDMPNVRFVKDQPPDLSSGGPDFLQGCLALLWRLLGMLLNRRERKVSSAALSQRQREVLPIANLIPSYEGRITLAPSQVTRYTFGTDLDGETSGTVHVFHVMEIEAGVVQGGVTLLMIKQ